MGRPLRIEYAGAFYHITSRGNERKPIFRAEKDYERIIGYLESATERYGAQIHCFCLMPNHYHLLLETPRGNLSAILHHVNTSYTNYFNAKWNRVGHLLQGRYRALLVEKDSYALELSRYIHLNPVRANLVEEPYDYVWSSYRAYVEGERSWPWLRRDFLLGQMSPDKKEAQKNYRRYVEEALGEPVVDPLNKVIASTLLGSENFIEWVREKWAKKKGSPRDIPALKNLASHLDLQMLRRKSEEIFGEGTLLSRKTALYLGHRYSGLSLGEIGKFFGGISPSAVSQNTRRFQHLIEGDPGLSRKVGKLVENFSQ